MINILKTIDFLGKEVELLEFILAIGAIVIGLVWLISLIVYLFHAKKKRENQKKQEKDEKRTESDSLKTTT